jgi:hypothetical protein
MRTFWRREEVEWKAEDALDKFRRLGGSLEPPIDVDMVGELVYDLHMDWEVIQEDGRTILAGLHPRERRIAMNEKHKELFVRKSGLERFTKGHEIGHWVLHVDEASLDYPVLPGMEIGVNILCRDGEDSWREKQAEWFSAALLMPANILIPICQKEDLMQWNSLYKIAERFDVTITALCTRLSLLGLNFVDCQGNIHRSRADYMGQGALI